MRNINSQRPKPPRTGDSGGLISQTLVLTLALRPQRRWRQKCPCSVGTLRAWKPFLKTLFIFCFFLLAQQVATLLAQTEGYSEHRGRGRGVSRPAGAGLTAVFYSDGHELSIHYCYGGFRSHHHYSGAVFVCLIKLLVFLFFTSLNRGRLAYFNQLCLQVTSKGRRQGTGYLYNFSILARLKATGDISKSFTVTGKNIPNFV